MSTTPFSLNPKTLAEQGEKIYRERYKEQFERDHHGMFVAIDAATGKAYLANEPEVALVNAKKDAPSGLFHLIRVGFAGAFRVSYTSDATLDWIFQ